MKRVSGFLTVLGLAVACGEAAKRPEPVLVGAAGANDAGGAESNEAGGVDSGVDTAGAAGSNSPVAQGGASGAPEQPTSGGAPEAAGAAGDATSAGGVPFDLPGLGNAGAGGVDSCVDEPPSDAPVELAKTWLGYFEGVDVALGQGFQYTGVGPRNGELRARGCVTGEETNQARWNLPGIGSELTAGRIGGGTQSLGSLSPFPFSVAMGLGALEDEFELGANGPSQRSLSAYYYSHADLTAYSLEHGKRSQKDDCGDQFVRSVSPAQGVAVAFRITLPTIEERETFQRCYLPWDRDFTALDDAGPAQNYLRAHHAELSIWVLMTGGDRQAVETILDDTGCSVAHLESCSLTLDMLEKHAHSVGYKLPDASSSLADLYPWWRITGFSTSPYGVLRD